MANTARGFREVDVTNFSSQQKKQRFPLPDSRLEGLGTPDFDGDAFHSDDDDDNEGQPPHIAEWRSNLVALSQRRNLYFAAYRNKVHVTIPRGLKQILPGNADLILDLPVSNSAILVGGYIDATRPHCVNHMMIGNFGTHEILLMSCDDGDVLGYYTHTIGTVLESRTRTTSILPFFHENVGMSAWGLAIHAQSRLLAVSSNLKEVTVFVPAYSNDSDLFGEYFSTSSSFPEASSSYKSSINFRRSNTRRVLRLGLLGNNIPSIDFSSDVTGEAKSILATDIKGTLWILGIWNDQKECIPGMHRSDQNEAREGGVMGWGVLSIPLTAFKSTGTPQEALGMRDINSVFSADELGEKVEPFFNITQSTRLVKDNNSMISWPGLPTVVSNVTPNAGSGLVSDDDEDRPGTGPMGLNSEPIQMVLANRDSDEVFYPAESFMRPASFDAGTVFPRGTSPEQLDSFKYTPDPLTGPAATRRREAIESFRYMVNMPADVVETVKSSKDLLRLLGQHVTLKSNVNQFGLAVNAEKAQYCRPMFLLPDKSAIIRTYQFDVELIPPSKSMPKTVCRKIVKRSLPPALALLRPFERLCFLTTIPELSLLIVGSQAGRAALITLTQPDIFSENGPVVNFRVDLILPGKKQEDEGLKPNLPLFGLAVSPVQTARKNTRARSWRLIMHYYDHSVLAYELSRDEQTDDLLVL